MESFPSLTPSGRRLLNRRGFLFQSSGALGALGLTELLFREGCLASSTSQKSEAPYAPRAPHHPVPARRVLIIFCPGAVSHVDTFDYKPDLIQRHGENHQAFLQSPLKGPVETLPNPSGTSNPVVRAGK